MSCAAKVNEHLTLACPGRKIMDAKDKRKCGLSPDVFAQMDILAA